MKINEDSAVYQKAYEALVDEHAIWINPRALITVLEVALDGRLTRSHSNRLIKEAKEQVGGQYTNLLAALDTLREVRGMLDQVAAWTGDSEYRDRTAAKLDDLIAGIEQATSHPTDSTP